MSTDVKRYTKKLFKDRTLVMSMNGVRKTEKIISTSMMRQPLGHWT